MYGDPLPAKRTDLREPAESRPGYPDSDEGRNTHETLQGENHSKVRIGTGTSLVVRGRTELSLPRALVQSLVRELRSCKLCVEAKIHT